jgi:hypothetical protein
LTIGPEVIIYKEQIPSKEIKVMKVKSGDVLVCSCEDCNVELTVTKACSTEKCDIKCDINAVCCDKPMKLQSK